MNITMSFSEIKILIDSAKFSAIQAINNQLIQLYWNIGSYIYKKVLESEWGDKTIDQLADYLNSFGPDYKGFNRRNLYRMKQFYETYPEKEIVSAVPTQLSCTMYPKYWMKYTIN